MSDPLRVALVAEGPTDAVVVDAALRALLSDVPFIMRQIQPGTPGEDELGGSADATSVRRGCGWGGVYRWCREVSGMGSGDVLTTAGMDYDFLIIHLDVDVSCKSYAEANIPDPVGETLPCRKDCPPASAAADALQAVVESWLAPANASNVIWCFPAYNTETWVFAACKKKKAQKIDKLECHHGIGSRLTAKPPIKKCVASYRERLKDLKNNWETVVELCPQASNFSAAVRSAMAPRPEARP